MMELPEAIHLAKQISETFSGKRISGIITGHTPHKFAWYYSDAAAYPAMLEGKVIRDAHAVAGWVVINAGDTGIAFGDGIGLRYIQKEETRPVRHQLLVEFGDGTALAATVQMYGSIAVFPGEEYDNQYFEVAREKPSLLSPAFDRAYFEAIISTPEVQKLSVKGLLATEQRIPGLGNGVLQDVLFNARLHPRKKTSTLDDNQKAALFNSLKITLSAMVDEGGRNTETDIFGNPGGYRTVLSKNTLNTPCPVCGTIIKKEAYMGGSVYFCEHCQVK